MPASHHTTSAPDRAVTQGREGAGRCDMAPQLTLEEMGKAFAVTSYGDLAAR